MADNNLLKPLIILVIGFLFSSLIFMLVWNNVVNKMYEPGVVKKLSYPNSLAISFLLVAIVFVGAVGQSIIQQL